MFDREVRCNTVARDGSDFFITGPSPVNVTHADISLCDGRGLIKTMDIQFDRSILVPGNYLINFKTGTDSTGIVDTCGAVVNVPYRFNVSDAGVTPTATPPVLCKAGYTTLSATTEYQPYGSIVRCGTNGGPDVANSALFSGTTGTLTDTVVRGAITPFDDTKLNARTQFLYTAAELQGAGFRAGRIKAMTFFVGKKNSTKAYRNLNLKMGCTARTNMTGGFTPGLPIVFSRDSFQTRIGDNQLVFDNAYDWNGQSNILVELCYNNTDTTTGTPRGFDQLVFSTIPNSVYQRTDTTRRLAGCAFVNNSGTGGGFTDTRPTARFDMLLPPAPTYEWLWQPGTFVQDSTAQTTLAFIPNDRRFTIQIRDSSACYRRGSVGVMISVRNPYGHPNNDTSICIGGKAHLLVGNGVRYQWFPSESLSCTDCPDPYAAPTQTTTYYAAIFDQYGCSDTLSATVIVNALPLVSAGKDTSVLYGSAIPLYAMAPGARYYAWTPIAGLNYANIPNPLAAPLETTTYQVQVIDTNYCIAFDDVTVRVNRNVPIFVPDAFTPNGDNRNDVFQVINLGINRLVEMRIYNRWGTEVCNTTDNVRGWDGNYRGVPQDPGVYKYLIRVTKPDGTAETLKGDLTLLR